jgi:hypothetical protein
MWRLPPSDLRTASGASSESESESDASFPSFTLLYSAGMHPRGLVRGRGLARARSGVTWLARRCGEEATADRSGGDGDGDGDGTSAAVAGDE